MLFSLTGMSSLASGSGVHVMTFQTADAAHGWLNDVIAVGEGSIDPDRGLLAMRYHVCTADYLPSIEARADQLSEARLAADGGVSTTVRMHGTACCAKPLGAAGDLGLADRHVNRPLVQICGIGYVPTPGRSATAGALIWRLPRHYVTASWSAGWLGG